ncbi:hypothetical protein [Flexivirga sp.]|uniref:hypothetical protein n=1 Tax=Flexivirga sp. TaxID=1962927 RepID=UPI003F8231EB
MKAPDLWPSSATARAATPFVVIGLALVIAAGLVSAAAAPTASYHSSWAVAYLVLVAGVAQGVLGLGQAVLTAGTVPLGIRWAQLCCWNLGNAAVVAGTLTDVRPLLYLGCLLLVVTVVLLLRTTTHVPSNWLVWTMRAVVIVLLVSVPTGIVLQALTH